jgi:hypothetical protein
MAEEYDTYRVVLIVKVPKSQEYPDPRYWDWADLIGCQQDEVFLKDVERKPNG